MHEATEKKRREREDGRSVASGASRQKVPGRVNRGSPLRGEIHGGEPEETRIAAQGRKAYDASAFTEPQPAQQSTVN
jgi:hypothetical protein